MEAGSEARNTRIADGGIAWRRLPLAALVAAAAASIANVLVLFAASGAGFITRDVLVPTAGGESPITTGMVVASSVAGAVAATAVFAGIGLFARRPMRIFRIVSVAALALSFAMPLTLAAPVPMILSLEAMHIVAWAAVVGILTTLPRRKEGGTR
ncbi:MAG: hypothetical protein H0U65_00405 [Rubrobacter sp.]|jgi:hypothetical protein|nr:hypothetical protein [Rubrobacter sp.]